MQRATDMQKEKECRLCFRRASVRAPAISFLENFQDYSRKMQILCVSAVRRGNSSSEITPMGMKLFSKKDGIIFRNSGFNKIFFPFSGWDKNSLLHKPKSRLTIVIRPVELPCLDTAAWYFASLSFIEVSVMWDMSRLFLVSALSGLSAGLVSTRCPRKRITRIKGNFQECQ